MPHIRISASELDSYLYLRSNENMLIEDMVSDMRKEFERTPQMELGVDLHEALEHSEYGKFDELVGKKYTYQFSPKLADIEIELTCFRETKAVKDYKIDGFDVTLVGKIDASHGRTIYDHKTTQNTIQPEKYLDGYQWRAYLDIFDADEFQWNVFKVSTPKNGVVSITDFATPKASRYPNMRTDLEQELGELVSFISNFLPERLEGHAK